MKNVLLTIPVFVKLEVMGASLDWSRATFTMDPEHSKAVAEAFKRLYDKGEFASHSFYFTHIHMTVSLVKWRKVVSCLNCLE